MASDVLGGAAAGDTSGCRDVPAVTAAVTATAGDTPAASPPPDCVICFAPYDRLFKVPKVLGCGHTFCLQCLAKVTLVVPPAPTLPCPICRRPTALPRRRGVPALPTPPQLLDLLPPGPTASVRFNRPKGLLYVPPRPPKHPDEVPTVALSLELGPPEPPDPLDPPDSPSLGSNQWFLYRAVALAVVLMVTGGLVFCGVFFFFLQPVGCEDGGVDTNSTLWESG